MAHYRNRIALKVRFALGKQFVSLDNIVGIIKQLEKENPDFYVQYVDAPNLMQGRLQKVKP